MVSEKYPLNANAQIIFFRALLTGTCLKVTAGPFLNMHRVRILTYLRGTLGEMKTKHGALCTSVSCGSAGLLMFDSEFGNTGQRPPETSLDQQPHPFDGDTAVSSGHDRWWLSEASVLHWVGWDGEWAVSFHMALFWSRCIAARASHSQFSSLQSTSLHLRKLCWQRLEVGYKLTWRKQISASFIISVQLIIVPVESFLCVYVCVV